MPASFLIAPDPSDTNVAFALPKKIGPYARAFYQTLKREGETFDLFVCRIFCQEAARAAMRIKLSEVAEQRRTDDTLDSVALGQELTDVLR